MMPAKMKTQAESETAKPLADERAAVFEREGYLVIEDVLTDDELRPVCDEITAAIDHFAKPLVESGELSRLYDEYDFEHRLIKICEETRFVAHSIWDGHLSGPQFFELIRNPKLLDIAEAVVLIDQNTVLVFHLV